jgi:adenylate cyclase
LFFFQLIKSLGNPFKSIIKIGVLEKYLFSPPDEPLLSQKVKAAIQSGNFENKILDSYILMFEEVYHYYESVLEDKSLLTILKQNLYLKIDPQLSKYGGVKDKRNVPYKVIVMYKYIKEWGSSTQGIKELDNFENWDYNNIMTFWNQVKKFMLLSYQKISQQLPTLNLAQKISDSDFKLLSRKIKTHFSSSEDKIDQYVTFKETPHESILYIEPINVGIKEVEWRMYKRTLRDKEAFDTTLKTEKYLIKLLAWISINQIFHPTLSRLKIQSGYTRVDPNLVNDILTKIANMFSGMNIPIKNDYYLKPAINLINVVILNYNSKNADAIQTIHYIFKTSWGESYIHEYNSERDHITIIENILTSGTKINKKFTEFCEIISPEPFKKLYKDIEQFYQEAYGFLNSSSDKDYRRFVTVMGGLYYSIVREKNLIKVSSYDSFYKLLATINLLPKMNIQTKFFGDDKKLMTLNDILKLKKNFMITLVYEEAADGLFLYIINENGNVFTFTKAIAKKEEAIINLYNFCQKAIKQVTEHTAWPNNSDAFQIYRLDTDRYGKTSFLDESKMFRAQYLSKFKGDKSISVTILRQPAKEPLFIISFPDGSQSEPTPFKKLIEVLLRKNPARSYLSLDSILFDGAGIEPINTSSPYFLNKYRLEIILDKIFK